MPSKIKQIVKLGHVGRRKAESGSGQLKPSDPVPALLEACRRGKPIGLEMPNVPRLLIAAQLALSVLCHSTPAADRYSDWRSEASPSAAEEPPSAEPYRPIPDEEAQTPGPPPDWQSPPRKLRKLPFRFERAPAGYDGSRVVLASATEPAKLLPRPSSPGHDEKQPRRSAGARSASSASALSIAGSVAVVIGLFLIVAWMARRGAGAVPPTLPREALEVLGRARFAGKQEMQLVRLGNKLVLIHVVPGHTESLCEITDPAEVDRLTGICYQLHRRSSTRSFRETFDKFSRERPAARNVAQPAARPAADRLDLSIFEDVGRRAS